MPSSDSSPASSMEQRRRPASSMEQRRRLLPASSSSSSSSSSSREQRRTSSSSNAGAAFITPPPPPAPWAPPVPVAPSQGSSSRVTIAEAVVATAASIFVVFGLLFFALHCFIFKQRKAESRAEGGRRRRDSGCREQSGGRPPPPQPGPLYAKRNPAPPAPPPPRPSPIRNKNQGPSGPPTMPRSSSRSLAAEGASEENAKAPTKLKPLYWDKMTTAHAQHSTVWDKIANGSFRLDDDQMEALFGYVATDRKFPNNSSSSANPFNDEQS